MLGIAKKRKSSAFKMWLTKARKIKEEENKKKELYVGGARNLVDATKDRMRDSFETWRRKA